MSDTATTTLAEFLLQRIAEDEADAERGRSHPDPSAFARDDYGYLWVQPSRVLADCEAKRQIVEQLERHERLVKANAEELAKASSSQPLDQERITALRTHGWELSGRLEALRMAADSLAAIWSDHPDYREEWRP